MGMENRPLFYRVLSISGGAGFLLSTVADFFFSPNGFFETSKPLSFLLFFKCHQNKGDIFSFSSGLWRIWY